MRSRTAVLSVLFLLLTAVTGCGVSLDDSRLDEPPTAKPTPTATAAPITEDPAGYARAFYRAWDTGDYLGMYSLLTPTSQGLVDSAAFISRYEEAMKTAAISNIHTQFLGKLQTGDTAEFAVRVTLTSDIVGDLIREFTVPMAYEGDRWGIVWDEGLIMPELAGGNRLTLEARVPSRGNIYDVNGKALAYQGSAYELGVIPGRIQD